MFLIQIPAKFCYAIGKFFNLYIILLYSNTYFYANSESQKCIVPEWMPFFHFYLQSSKRNIFLIWANANLKYLPAISVAACMNPLRHNKTSKWAKNQRKKTSIDVKKIFHVYGTW